MIYIYRRAASDSASELAEALNDANVPARRTQGGLLREARVIERLRAGRDRLVCWGDASPIPAPDIPHVLNGGALQNKYEDALQLAAMGVPTIAVSHVRPQDRPAGRPAFLLGLVGPAQLNEGQATALLGQLQAYLAQPLPPAETWLARRNNHVGGQDLLQNLNQGDYWSKREALTEEFRVHLFGGKSIRAGHKVRRPQRPDGTPSHEWIRSFDAGWVIAYENFQSSKAMRDLATRAVNALGLQFGAVDIGQRQDGSLLVLEVNRAPGIEGGSTQAYVGAIKKWIEEV